MFIGQKMRARILTDKNLEQNPLGPSEISKILK